MIDLNNNTKIMIATHKPYDMPTGDCFLPVFCGAFGKEDIGYQRDDEGENISEKNDRYSELTATFWGWKNIDCDYIGLMHYRRRFVTGRIYDADIIVPKKRRYYIESLYTHYSHTFDAAHLDVVKEIVEEKYPEYLASLVTVYSRTWGYMWNMTIMRRDLFDKYCEFIFGVLFEAEKRIEVEALDAFNKRLFGRVSEILLNVWLENELSKEKEEIKLLEVPVFSTESVPWVRKITAFLLAKFFGKKYDKSF